MEIAIGKTLLQKKGNRLSQSPTVVVVMIHAWKCSVLSCLRFLPSSNASKKRMGSPQIACQRSMCCLHNAIRPNTAFVLIKNCGIGIGFLCAIMALAGEIPLPCFLTKSYFLGPPTMAFSDTRCRENFFVHTENLCSHCDG